MKKRIITEKHYSVTIAKQVTEICQPLFDRYGLNKFVYARIYDAGYTYALVSDEAHHQVHLNENYPLVPSVPEEMLANNFIYLPHENNCYGFQPSLYNLRAFGAWCPIFMIERYYGFYDLFLFCAKKDNTNILNFYLSDRAVLENFKFYFKEKAARLIKKSQQEANHIVVPASMLPNFAGLPQANQQINQPGQQAPQHFLPKRYLLEYRGMELKLTQREVESIGHLSLGKTIKEIAQAMRLSPRTIEDHLEKIKNKLQLTKKSEIVKTIATTNLPLT